MLIDIVDVVAEVCVLQIGFNLHIVGSFYYSLFLINKSIYDKEMYLHSSVS